MKTKYPDLFERLSAPFDSVRTRPSKTGPPLPYIQRQDVMNRLDQVVGPENWWSELIPTGTAGGTSWLCKLSIRLPDGTVVTKQDVGANAGMEVRERTGEMVRDDENDDKSGATDALKRVAEHFGIGRYLRNNPAAAQPGQAQQQQQQAQGRRDDRPRGDDRGGSGSGYGPPKTGKALYMWAKSKDLLKYLNNWGRLQEAPGRMVDWDAELVAAAYREGSRKLQALQDRAAHAEAAVN